MNYLIWKNINSKDIKGLLISELPPITKPRMRVQETAIDGVDGSIIEELGFESYDKTITIGLTKGFDIDEVIEYFTGEGQVIFSNEPNKYYKARIIEQIDYERLLRFRTATVTFRVQPFKYEYDEEEQITETGSSEETEIKITDAKATEIKIDGRSTQEGTPTPDAPVEIKSVGYTNLCDGINQNYFINGNVDLAGYNVNDTGVLIPTNGRTEFTISSKTMQARFRVAYTNEIPSEEGNTVRVYGGVSRDGKGGSITVDTTNYKYLIVNATDLTQIQVEEGSVAHSYINFNKYGIEIKTVGKNLFDLEQYPFREGRAYNGSGEIQFWNGYCGIIQYFPVEENATYTFSNDVNKSIYYGLEYYDKNKSLLSYKTEAIRTFTTPKNCKYIRFAISNSELPTQVQIEKGSVATEYEPYKENATVIELNEPLRSLPNGTKDIAYLKNNKLYVDRKIGSVVLDGTQNINVVIGKTYKLFCFDLGNLPIKNATLELSNLLSNKGEGRKRNDLWNHNVEGFSYGDTSSISYKDLVFYCEKTKNMTVEEFKTWLSINNVQVDYELATPITEEYDDLTILELLDGENNISNSAEANMIVDYVDNKLIINNLGNYISKPIFQIEGAGTIKIILNNNSVFVYNFDEDGRVVIDSEKQDAYLGNALKNRNMTGDFPILNKGTNIITWDGLIKNIKVSSKSRWI